MLTLSSSDGSIANNVEKPDEICLALLELHQPTRYLKCYIEGLQVYTPVQVLGSVLPLIASLITIITCNTSTCTCNNDNQ